MPFPLNPAPNQLGITAPLLGPWFSPTPAGGAPVTLPAVTSATLGLPIIVPANVHWLPPTTGTLSLFVGAAAPSIPAPLAHLRDGTGAHPFAVGSLIAYFEILPEVAERLDALLGLLPPVTGQPLAVVPNAAPVQMPAPTRARVRSFALELPGACATDAVLSGAAVPGGALMQPLPDGASAFVRLRVLGLALNGVNAINGPNPMTWLRRPGTYALRDPITGAVVNTETDVLLHNVGTATGAQPVTLWAFDARGRAIDPGAVAAWWSWLLTDAVGDPNVPPGAPGGATPNWQLRPPGVALADYPPMQPGAARQAVCAYASGRSVLFVDPHDAPLAAGSVFLNNRLLAQGPPTPGQPASATPVPVSAALRIETGTPGPHMLTFADPPAPPAGATPPPDDPTPDDAPLPRMAVLPDGSGGYQTSLTLWPGAWPGAGALTLVRDFVRIAVVDEEFHLLGVQRGPSRFAAAPDKVPVGARRSGDQNRPSTRTVVARTADQNPVLLANADAVAQRLIGLFTPAAPTRAVLGVGDLGWGPVAGGLQARTAGGATLGFPAQLAEHKQTTPLPTDSFRVRALTGGGSDVKEPQAVLVEVQLGAPGAGNPHAGTWIRGWPLGFDRLTGTRWRLTGGGGRVDGTGLARLVVTLPPGRVDATGRLGIEILAARRAPNLPGGAPGPIEERSWGDVRFDRPAPIGGTLASAATLPGGASWYVCETGATLNAAGLANAVPSGGTLLLLPAAGAQTAPTLVDRTTLAAGAWNGTLGAALLGPMANAGNIVSLTAPAYLSTADRADALGRPVLREAPTPTDATGGIGAAVGAGLHYTRRTAGVPVEPSSPFSLQERLEVAAATVPAAGPATAVLGGAPPMPWVHEAAPGHLGHPGVPAAVEICGTGVVLTGTPALALAEHVRERTAGMGMADVRTLTPTDYRDLVVGSDLALLAETLAAPLPTPMNDGIPQAPPPATVGSVVAVLRTVAARQEGQPIVWQTIDEVGNYVPLSRTVADGMASAQKWLDGLATSLLPPFPFPQPPWTSLPPQLWAPGTALNGAAAPVAAQAVRALDRRLQATREGRRELTLALVEAFGRAQDLVYVETPMLDDEWHGPGDEQRSPWQTLADRVTTVPGLCVLLCVPSRLLPGAPRQLHEVRDHMLLQAIQIMRAAAGSRFAVFSPGAGAGRARRLATTTVVVDDVVAYTGTTHLSRRGLSFDASLAAAVFDERVTDGRCAEVLAFRRQLVADRLGIPLGRVPDDARALVRAVAQLDAQGSIRLSAQPILPPADTPSQDLEHTWNPDGLLLGAPGVEEPPVTLEKLTQLAALTGSEHSLAEP